MSQLAYNKKALFDYELIEKFEAGLVLSGAEVKSARLGQISLAAAYVMINQNGEAYLINATISPYKFAPHTDNYDPTHARKLLLHKREIDYLRGKIQQKGLTLVPISVYTKGTKIKLEFALCRGKKLFDKRQTIKEREQKRDLDQLKRQKS